MSNFAGGMSPMQLAQLMGARNPAPALPASNPFIQSQSGGGSQGGGQQAANFLSGFQNPQTDAVTPNRTPGNVSQIAPAYDLMGGGSTSAIQQPALQKPDTFTAAPSLLDSLGGGAKGLGSAAAMVGK